MVVLAGLLGAITWNLITWYFGLPVVVLARPDRRPGRRGARVAGAIVHWTTILDKVVIPMVLSPLVGFALAFAGDARDHVDLPAPQPAQGHPRLPAGADRVGRPRWRSATACRTPRRRWA